MKALPMQLNIGDEIPDILGVSIDGGDSHNKFIEKHDLPFPLIADAIKNSSSNLGFGWRKRWQAKNIWERSVQHFWSMKMA